MIGKTLAHYEISELLGVGGMGEVYLARDTKLGRDVALKVLPGEASHDSSLRLRLEQEARAIASLQHPNIVTLYSVEEDQGRLFLTMELARGPQLSKLVVAEGIDTHRLMELALPLTEATGAAHEKGIVHRDLKPSNIVLDQNGRPKILDFGLAKQLLPPTSLEDATEQMTLTNAGTVIGTCSYMSPEQAQGRDVDARSDVFSLGTLLYEVACGRRPFEGDNPISIMSAILKDEPAPLNEHNPALPGRLSEIIMRCLEKDPAQRWTNAMELHRELTLMKRSLDSGVAPTVARQSTPGKPWGPIRSMFVVLPMVVVLGFLAWKLVTARRDAPDPAIPATSMRSVIVVFPFENLGKPTDTYLAAGMTDEIVSRLTSVAGIGVISRTTAMRYDRQGKTLAQVAEDLGVNFVLDGTIRWDRHSAEESRVRITPELVRVEDRVSVWSQVFDREVRDVFTIQSEIARQVVTNIDVSLKPPASAESRLSYTENFEAYDYYLQAMQHMQWSMGRSEAELRLAGDLLEKALALDPEFAGAHARLSRVNSALHFREFDASESRLALAERAADQALRLAPQLAEAHLAKGLFYYRSSRDYIRALEELENARALAPGDGEILSWIGTIRKRQGRFAEAVEILQQAMRLDPYNSFIPGELAVVQRSLGEFAKALESVDRAIALDPSFTPKLYRARILADWKGDLAPLRSLLEESGPGHEFEWAGLYAMERRLDEALAALDSVRADPIQAPALFVWSGLARALLHWGRGEPERARDAVADLVPLLENMVEQNRYSNARLGLAYAYQGHGEDAVRQAKLALEHVPLTWDALFAVDVMYDVAQIYAVIDDVPSAVALLERLRSLDGRITIHRLRLDFVWDPIRNHPEFQALTQRVEGPQ